MEIVDGVVYAIRQSRSQPGMETVHVMVDDEDGQDGRVFPFHVAPGTYKDDGTSKVRLQIDGHSAEIIT